MTWYSLMVGDRVQVKCYSGYTYAQRPESFLWRSEVHAISRIEKEWLEPSRRCFRVITEGEKVFELCYNEVENEWRLVHFMGEEAT